MTHILKNKIILVTGGEGLIGKAIVKDINNKGGTAVNADVIFPKNDLVNNCLRMDVTDEKSMLEGIQLVKKHYGKIDGLVNNAYPRTKDFGNEFEKIDLDSWNKNLNYQLSSTFFCIQKIIPFLKETKGAIVNLGSIYGVVGNDLNIYENTDIKPVAPYSAIKGGIINFSRYLASYYGAEGIRVNVVSPGGIFNNQDPIFVKNYEHKVPMKRMGSPDDIAPAVSFLLSNEAKYITGQNLIVDGGWTAI
jgi:NAD(P)-dependent dehydrogenase (short-subunit alcohol dehydrogenase family)